MHIIHPSLKEFKTHIVDIENNPDQWKYLGNKPCIIEFSATWSTQSTEMAPILEELAAEYNNQIYIYRVDIEQEEAVFKAFDVEIIPTLLFCPLKDAPQKAVGVFSKSTLKEGIEEILLCQTT